MPTILICDDSSFMRNRVKSMVLPITGDIIEAVNGRDCLEKIETTQPDLLILDLLMPVLTGEEVLKQLKVKNISIPVIVLSADIQSSTKDECLSLGAYAFLNKPPHPEQLQETINNALSRDKGK